MLTSYMHEAMRLAKYEILEDGTYYGEIPGFQGVWANADLQDACREELQSALEDWLHLGLRLGHTLRLSPVLILRLPRRTMVKENLRLTRPNPHQGEINKDLFSRILKQADISRRE